MLAKLCNTLRARFRSVPRPDKIRMTASPGKSPVLDLGSLYHVLSCGHAIVDRAEVR